MSVTRTPPQRSTSMQLLPTQQSLLMTDTTPTRPTASGMHQLAPLPLPTYVGKRLLDVKPNAGQDFNGADAKGGRSAHANDNIGAGGGGGGDDDEPQQIQIEIPLAYVKKWNKSNKSTTPTTTTTPVATTITTTTITATAVNGAGTATVTTTATTTITTTVTTPKGTEMQAHTHV